MPPKRQKTIEEQYMKLSQLEHILLRPDSYVGSIEWQKDTLWIYDVARGGGGLTQKEVNYVPGLYKIFDEVLVNAADNFVRDPDHQTYIKVEIDQQAGKLSVENNGMGLPVEMHSEHNMYVPEMVFGHLLTSDNYDDGEDKVTGGRNGYGAKLANIFSTRFEIECADADSKKVYHQGWEENMKKKEKPKVTAHKGESYTKVTFWPDLQKFGMKKMDKDIIGLFTRRCYDVAGTTPKKCQVYLNGKRLNVQEFKEYVDLYVEASGKEEVPEVVYERFGDRWEVAMTVSDGQFQHVSFVNAISTPKGGTHVQHVADQLVAAIVKKANSKNRGGMEIKPIHVKNYIFLFVNAKVVNPSFDSQTKETMTLKQAKFGSKCEISDSLINKVLKTGIVDMILTWAKAKEEIDLGKTMKTTAPGKGGKAKRLLNIPKLEDANLAGGREGPDCTLIITEGDSAKSLAVAGLSIIGRDRYGVFPLRGKMLNVRDANFNQTMANAEIANITKILGIEPKKNYVTTHGMRYGHLMIMTDQDYDGSHIKGLIVNLIQHWWPSLFEFPGFVQEFVTPIVKVTKKAGGATQQFFTMHEYEQWKEETNNGRGYSIKYYKGLGTSTTQEAKEYFRNISDHSIDFEMSGDGDDAEMIDLAFNKKRADDRKDWINAADDGDVVDHSQATLTYADFVKKELVQFAKYDVMRSIPCVVDGFKPVMRKIMWSAFKRNLKSDTKVAQFAGYVSEKSAYHHGEVSLQGAIVALAQTFVGSNNLNLLTPSGQFGTRLQGGKDAASARYIYTRLERTARLIFHPDDGPLLEYNDEEGQKIEPRWFIPVIPMVLVNGADGIGTGWSTFLPNFSPHDIIANLKRFIRCEPLENMCPWYKGFRGSIVPSVDKDGYEIVGVIEKRGPTSLEITELPVRRWTQDYKEFLQGMLSTEGPGTGQIEDMKEYHTEGTVHFVITVTEEQMRKLESTGLEKAFKLRSSMAMSNLVFFDKSGKIKKYANEKEIIEDFAVLRLEYYHKRKDYILRRLKLDRDIISEKVRFIKLVVEDKLKVKNRKRDQLIEDLRKNGFRTMQEICEGEDMQDEDNDEQPDGAVGGVEEKAEGAPKKKAKSGGWEYLLGMPLWSLTMERVLDLENQFRLKEEETDRIEDTAPEDFWDSDLNAILDALDELEALAGLSAQEERRQRNTAMKRAASEALFSGKRRRGGPVAAAPPPSVLPSAGISRDGMARALTELQERQLSKTVAEFPGLFDDLVPGLKRTKSAASVKPDSPEKAKEPEAE
eukprot:TRINITY_DN29120_c0_g1_i1.p1 TRINITY_DN29120_c0_g1~~TRINITY_DN29120_c0_g1_i1.p1  ORF type:complete len:1271 (-),score=344.83 TRINITY_DN29120_c0_g1_i1:123-3935(-)